MGRGKIPLVIGLLTAALGSAAIYAGFLPNYPSYLFKQAEMAISDAYRASGLERAVYRTRTVIGGKPPPLPEEVVEAFERGVTAGQAGNWEQAAWAFDSAGDLAPYDTGLQYARAKAYQYAGNPAAAAMYLAIFSSEDEVRGRTAIIREDLGERLLDLQSAAEGLLEAAWSIAETTPPGSPARTTVLRIAAHAPTSRIVDVRSGAPYAIRPFIERIAKSEPILAGSVFASVAADLALIGRIPEGEALFGIAEAAARNSDGNGPGERAIDGLCAASRPPIPCRSVTTHSGLMGLPPVVEKRCERQTPLSAIRNNEGMQLSAQVLLVLALEARRAGKTTMAEEWWGGGNSWLGNVRLDHLCRLPGRLEGITPLPPDQSLGGGWTFDDRNFYAVAAEKPAPVSMPSIRWDADIIYDPIPKRDGGFISVGTFFRSPHRELERLQADYRDEIEKVPELLAAIAEDYLWILDLLLPHYQMLIETQR